MRNITVEICAGSVADCIAAKMSGVTRVELNSALHLGGLTATFGTLNMVKERCQGLTVMTMLRPRGAGFCYSDIEYQTMKRDAIALLKNGSDGIVFGFLKEDRTIDIEKTRTLVDLAKSYHKEAVFHRAFDIVEDRDTAISQLVELGINRVLTSGGAADCIKGIDEIKRLSDIYGNEIEIIAGGGIRHQNVREIIEKTGITQVHSSCRTWFTDPSTASGEVTFGYKEDHPHQYEGSDPEEIKAIIQAIRD